MIEQAIQLVEKHAEYAQTIEDLGMMSASRRVLDGLREALKSGVETLRSTRPHGPEVTHVEVPLVRARQCQGHSVKRQLRCSNGIIDIFDLTTDEIIECKHIGTGASLGEAASQLARYRRSFPGSKLVIAVLRVEASGEWLADILAREGIGIIELEAGG